jgi:hypothetical protein
LPADGARQQQVRDVGADEQEHDADEQHQRPERVGIAGIERVGSAAPRQRDEFRDLLRRDLGTVGYDHGAEQRRQLRSRHVRGPSGLHAADLPDPPVLVVLGRHAAGGPRRLE